MKTQSSTTRPDIGELEATMHRAWRAVIVAEERQADTPTLERLVARYLSAVEALVTARTLAARIRKGAA